MDTSVNKLSGQGVKFSEIPSHQMELSDFMSNILDSSWKQGRGMEIISVGIEKITPDDKSRARIEEFDTAVMLGNTQGAIQGAYDCGTVSYVRKYGKTVRRR